MTNQSDEFNQLGLNRASATLHFEPELKGRNWNHLETLVCSDTDFSAEISVLKWPLKSCYLQQQGGQTNILFNS